MSVSDTKVIERLRAADARETAEVRKSGFDEGRRWARCTATRRELDRLRGSPGAVDPADVLAVVTGRPDPDPADVEASWESVIGAGGYAAMSDPAFAAGWVEGALAAWEEVRREVLAPADAAAD